MQAAGTLSSRRADWSVHGRPPHWSDWVPLVTVAIAPGVAAAVLLWPYIGISFALAAMFTYLLVFLGWAVVQARMALAAAGAVDGSNIERLANMVAGLAADAQMPTPRVFVSETAGANALVCPAHGGSLLVTRDLLDRYTRTELEAVLAHCLVRLQTAEVRRASLAVALGPVGRELAPRVGFEDDVRAAALTRYPPALAAALGKASPRRRDRYAPYWFVAEDPPHRAVSERVVLIQDL